MRVATLAALLAGLGWASLAAANPFDDLTKDGNDACFHRVYDAAHLKKNPRQHTTSMTVWIAGKSDAMPSGNTGLALTRRGDPQPLFLAGGCEWGNFNWPPDWMPSFTKKVGAGCVTLAVPDVFVDVSSAEEGGSVLLDPATDGKTLTVHVADHQSMVKRTDRAQKIAVRFGADDRVFLLRRADAKACNFVKDAVTTPEPGKR